MSHVKMISPEGFACKAEFDRVRERMKGEVIHYSDDGYVCLKCFKFGPFVWMEGEHNYEEHPQRCTR